MVSWGLIFFVVVVVGRIMKASLLVGAKLVKNTCFLGRFFASFRSYVSQFFFLLDFTISTLFEHGLTTTRRIPRSKPGPVRCTFPLFCNQTEPHSCYKLL